MSAFALLIPPAPLTGTPSQAYRTLRYRAVVSCQSSVFRFRLRGPGFPPGTSIPGASRGLAACARPPARRTATHPHSRPRQNRDRGRRCATVWLPRRSPTPSTEPNALDGAQRHDDIAPELDIRADLPPRPFGQQRTHRLRRPPHLIRDAAILRGLRKALAGPMHIQGQRVSTPEHNPTPKHPRPSNLKPFLATCLTD
jgi:hypothetical protein